MPDITIDDVGCCEIEAALRREITKSLRVETNELAIAGASAPSWADRSRRILTIDDCRVSVRYIRCSQIVTELSGEAWSDGRCAHWHATLDIHSLCWVSVGGENVLECAYEVFGVRG